LETGAGGRGEMLTFPHVPSGVAGFPIGIPQIIARSSLTCAAHMPGACLQVGRKLGMNSGERSSGGAEVGFGPGVYLGLKIADVATQLHESGASALAVPGVDGLDRNPE
jgi:hypothetical protein